MIFKYLLLSLAILCFGLLTPSAVHAADVPKPAPINVSEECSTANSNSAVCNNNRSLADIVRLIASVLVGLSVGVAFIIIVIAGIRLTSSAGNPDAVKGAKNMIIYAIVGIIVVVLAYALVTFVVGLTNGA